MVIQWKLRLGVRKILRPGVLLILLLAAASLLFPLGISGSMARASGDLDGDGRTEEYYLENGSLSIREGTLELWKTPEDWHIDSFVLGDATNDKEFNLAMSLWKEGSFGKIRPFWHSGEDNSYRNHLFVYALRDKRFQPVWCSSDLDFPILSFDIRDADGDGRNELVTEEGRYRKPPGKRRAADLRGPVRTAVWKWEEWGFSLVEERGLPWI